MEVQIRLLDNMSKHCPAHSKEIRGIDSGTAGEKKRCAVFPLVREMGTRAAFLSRLIVRRRFQLPLESIQLVVDLVECSLLGIE